MRYPLLLLLVIMLVHARPLASQDGCRYSLAFGVARPATIIGTKNIADQSIVLAQRDSPVAIVGLDLTQFEFIVSSETYESQPSFRATVKNLSDRRIETGSLFVFIVTSEGSSGIAGTVIDSLGPGEKKIIESVSGFMSGEAPGNTARLVFGVDRVAFNDCEYWPSRWIPVLGGGKLDDGGRQRDHTEEE